MMADDYTQAEVVRSLNRIESSVTELRAEVRLQQESYVSRGEYNAWKEGLGREIGSLKSRADANEASKPPWTSIASLVVAIAALAVVVIPLLAA